MEPPDLSVEIEQAREAALRALGSKGRSRAELSSALTRKGFSSESAHAALERLERVGLVDDVALARDLVARARQDRAGSALVAGLLRRGIDRELATRAVAEVAAEPAAAYNLVAKRWSGLSTLDEPVALRRTQGLLARRGFDPGCAAGILTRLRTEGR